MIQYTEEQLKDPKVRIQIYQQALKDWRTPWIFMRKNRPLYTGAGFCYYFFQRFKLTSLEGFFLGFELYKLKTTQEAFNPYWFSGTGSNRKGRRARRKALRQAIQICKQKIEQNV